MLGLAGSMVPAGVQMGKCCGVVGRGIEVCDLVVAFPGVRQRVIAQAELQAETRRDVPVIHRIKGRRLVDVVATRSGLELRVAGSEPEQDVHEAVVGCAARGVRALFVAEELLVFCVAVVAEAELHGVSGAGPEMSTLGS